MAYAFLIHDEVLDGDVNLSVFPPWHGFSYTGTLSTWHQR